MVERSAETSFTFTNMFYKKSPSKRAFEKYKPRGLFSDFYGSPHRLYLL